MTLTSKIALSFNCDIKYRMRQDAEGIMRNESQGYLGAGSKLSGFQGRQVRAMGLGARRAVSEAVGVE